MLNRETLKTLNAALAEIDITGPRRVLVDDHCAVDPDSAASDGIFPSIVYIRDDGWTLGCVPQMQVAGYDTWAGSWLARVDLLLGTIDLID